MGSFLYPRTIKITRPPAQTGVGFQPRYTGDQAANETAVAQNLPASIQNKARQGRGVIGLPMDGDQTEWRILIPKRAIALGKILQRDIVTDDTNERYQITANYYDSLGYALIAVKLQA